MGFQSIAAIMPWQGSPTSKAVLMALAFHRNDQSGRCDPSNATLMAETCHGKRTIVRAIRDLEKSGIITATRSCGSRTTYQINQCRSGTSARAAPVPHSPQPVPLRHQTSAAAAPEQEEQVEQEGEQGNELAVHIALASWVRTSASDQERGELNRAELAQLCQRHSQRRIQQVAERLAHALHRKVFPNEISESLLAEQVATVPAAAPAEDVARLRPRRSP